MDPLFLRADSPKKDGNNKFNMTGLVESTIRSEGSE